MAGIGVVGLGSVETAVLHGMSLFHECSGYDIVHNYDLKTWCISTGVHQS